MNNVRIVNKWRWQNKALFHAYAGEWVAFNDIEGIIAHESNVKGLFANAIEKGYKKSDFVIEFIHPESVPNRPFNVKILPIRIKAVKKHDWTPNYSIILIGSSGEEIEASMLIDSGADISVISKQIGEELGLTFSKNDIAYEANGVGGGILQYILKQIDIIIDNQQLTIPVAWILADNLHEMIIGREKVFDLFDVEFKQADEEIVFKYRNQNGI